jgi:GMP synthase-like glutamine amidotransferase
MKIGILQTGNAPDQTQDKHGDYDEMFERLLAGREFEFSTYEVMNNQFPASVLEQQAWLITGSRFGAYEDHAWIPPLEDFLRSAYAAGTPIIGVCFGHQILAQALGGTVQKFDGGWSVGPVEYNMVDAQAGTRKSTLMAWHQDQVTKLPEDAEVIGSTEFCQYAMLAYNDRALTIQPHPEFSNEFGRDLLAARGAILPSHIVEQAKQNMQNDLQAASIADQFEAFLKRDRSPTD